ncbi:MAG: hypothetical protein IBJ09_14285, partial [Bacteroidia bacterium]|nr:hypothetical protein [Bacteroidia bacterium]
MVRTGIFILLFILSAALSAQKQLAPVRHFDIFSGLPAKTLYNMCVDKRGFIWLAAENGLFRFDGQRFYQYTTRDGLCDNEIIEIFCDSKNRIWCSGYNGKISLLEKGVVNNDHGLIRNWQSRGFIFDIAEDAAGNIYMAGEKKQLLRIDTGLRVRELPVENTGTDMSLSAVTIYKNRLYVYTGMGVFVSGPLPGAEPLTLCLRYPRSDIGALFSSRRSGNIWSLEKDNSLFGLQNGERIEPPCPPGTSYRPLEVNERYLIIEYTYSGSILYDRHTQESYPLRLPDYARISDAISDIQGNIWISTRRNGLYVIRPGVYRNTELPAADPSLSVLTTTVSGGELLSVTAFGDVILQSEKGTRRHTFHTRNLRPLEYASVQKIKGEWYVTSDLMSEDKQIQGIHFFGYSNKESIGYRDSLLFLRTAYTVYL